MYSLVSFGLGGIISSRGQVFPTPHCVFVSHSPYTPLCHILCGACAEKSSFAQRNALSSASETDEFRSPAVLFAQRLLLAVNESRLRVYMSCQGTGNGGGEGQGRTCAPSRSSARSCPGLLLGTVPPSCSPRVCKRIMCCVVRVCARVCVCVRAHTHMSTFVGARNRQIRAAQLRRYELPRNCARL